MILYRQFVEEDIPALTELNGESFRDGLKRSDGETVWCAVLKNRIVAFAAADRGAGEVRKIVVAADHRNRGIARQLMRQAEAWLFSHGWKEISVAIPENHLAAAGFFTHLGWEAARKESGCGYFKKDNPGPIYRLEEHTVSGPDTGYERLVRLHRGPSERPHRLCLFLDGEHYWRDMGAVPMLHELCAAGAIPEMTFAFVGHVSAAARHEDYTCNEQYGRFVGEYVVNWLKTEMPGIQEGNHLIVGLSLSGLMAVYMTLQYPELFGACLSQSGSHWWRPEWFAKFAREKSGGGARFWLSVGDEEIQTKIDHPPTGLHQEISQIEGVEKAAEVLRQIGGAVRCNRFSGGHAIRCWRQELGEALAWLTVATDVEE